MKIKYVVRITTYCMDGSHETRWVDFKTNLSDAQRFKAREQRRKLLCCDARKDIHLLRMEA